ncbi:ABC transporter substrate-binding protein [Vibrio sp. S4M6]|uniref:ABC transporter substrate-binding protein n=1 Tax=Vibrio sinus TaxID=2946865 RepID=UPI00202A0030|nr:ABC transporter substrate-binding protein [Vibrio sinus]MCL9780023.1 ABC transporter substrate-binding protein [Vibrio sinus]
MKRLLVLVFLSAIWTTPALAEKCGTVTIADMNWNSASLIANIDQFILENGYGCDAQLIPGDTMPTGTSMIEKGQPDVAPELWTNSLKEALDKGVSENRLRYTGHVLIDGGEEGFWVPAYMVKKYPELKTIEGIKKHAKLFKNPEDPDSSAFYGCPAGWACQISAENLFKALKLKDAGFTLVDPGSSAGLSGALAKANERKEPWFGYYWAPTAILGKYAMVKVDFGTGVHEKEFVDCITQADCENPTVSMYPVSPVYTVTTEKFASQYPDVNRYFVKRGFTNQELNKLLAWMEDNQADGNEAMHFFLENYPQTWQRWVPADVAKKVESAL